jgi:CheY-like chemotaxis protein
MKTVLLVDDDAAIRRAVVRMLRDEPVEVQEAVDASEALKLLRSGLVPAVILSDTNMPGMSGLKLAKVCQEEFPNVPFILCSAEDHEEDAAALGVPYYDKVCDNAAKVLRAKVRAAL